MRRSSNKKSRLSQKIAPLLPIYSSDSSSLSSNSYCSNQEPFDVLSELNPHHGPETQNTLLSDSDKQTNLTSEYSKFTFTSEYSRPISHTAARPISSLQLGYEAKYLSQNSNKPIFNKESNFYQPGKVVRPINYESLFYETACNSSTKIASQQISRTQSQLSSTKTFAFTESVKSSQQDLILIQNPPEPEPIIYNFPPKSSTIAYNLGQIQGYNPSPTGDTPEQRRNVIQVVKTESERCLTAKLKQDTCIGAADKKNFITRDKFHRQVSALPLG